MTPRMIVATALIAAAGVLPSSGVALAQSGNAPRTPAHADFDVCNREAQAATGPSASPRTGVGASVVTGPGAAGAAGATGGTGALMDGSTLSSGPAGGDPTLRGIAAGGASDPAYREAYRDCLTRRGF